MSSPYYRILIRDKSFIVLPMYWFDELFYRDDNFCLDSNGEPLCFTSKKSAIDFIKTKTDLEIPIHHLSSHKGVHHV